MRSPSTSASQQFTRPTGCQSPSLQTCNDLLLGQPTAHAASMGPALDESPGRSLNRCQQQQPVQPAAPAKAHHGHTKLGTVEQKEW